KQLKTAMIGKSRRLAIVLATDNEAAKTYVGLKQKQAQELGISVEIVELNAQTTIGQFADKIDGLRDNPGINGIMIQLPVYSSLQGFSPQLVNLIPPDKDVDGLTAFSQGEILQNLRPFFYPATVAAILECLRSALAPATDLLTTDYSNLETHLRGR